MYEYLNPEHFKPYPEFVAEPGAPYEIVDSGSMPGLPTNGMTDKLKRIIWVPLDEAGRAVSMHELAHVRWSPRRFNVKRLDAPLMIVRAIEDARINLGLDHVGLPLRFVESLCREVVGIGERDLARGDVVTFTLRAAAALGTNVEQPLLTLVAGDHEPIFATVRELVAETRKRLMRARWRNRDVVASFHQGVCVARWLARELKKRGFPEPEDDGVVMGCCGGFGKGADGKHGRGRSVRRSVPGWGDGVRPGRLHITTPPLLHPCATPATGLGRRMRAVAEGTDFRYMERFAVDQCVFARPIRNQEAGGGSVLIDVSGSMCLEPADIDRIIENAPAATLVALYSGRLDRGELRIVVRAGRRAATADLKPYGGGNIVDLPALEWLAKQRGPRVWISDGGTTGCGDTHSSLIDSQCQAVCKAAGIVRVPDAAGAARALARGH